MKAHVLIVAGLAALTCVFANRDASVIRPTADVPDKKTINMKMNAGIITPHLQDTRKFYTEMLGFSVVYESDWFLLLSTPDSSAQISFLQPEHPTQQPLFQEAFAGRGVYLTIEVDDVDALYRQLKAKALPIAIDLRNEPWGDRHFAVIDPNGVGIDFVKYTAPTP